MSSQDERIRAMSAAYDDEAAATGWLGPQVAFGLAYDYIRPGQSLLDIGIGTGLGSVLFRKAGLYVYGMDISPEMLAACQLKGFDRLLQHDLTEPPYPYESGSLDHAVSMGVFNFVPDLNPVFAQCARILRTGGLFVFVVGDRGEHDDPQVLVGAEHTGTGAPMMMYRHSASEVGHWVQQHGFVQLHSLGFLVPMDRCRTQVLNARAYLVTKATCSEQVA